MDYDDKSIGANTAPQGNRRDKLTAINNNNSHQTSEFQMFDVNYTHIY